jgi:hypothetical protein
MEERNYVFNLKYRNEGLSINDFVEKSINGELPAYLETDQTKSEGDIQFVNTQNV